jgi:hypothetical protein
MQTLTAPVAQAVPLTEDVERSRLRRADRWRHLNWLRGRSHRRSGRACMLAGGFDRDGSRTTGVTMAGSAAGVVHTAGVARCASPWACPMCAPTIGERRAAEIDAAAAGWLGLGGSLYFVTATLRHSFGDDIDGLLDMLQGAWSRTFRFQSRPDWYGGMIRAVEVTTGTNGWHPHIHALIFVEDTGWTPAQVEHELDCMRWDWQASVELYGGSTVVEGCGPGWDVRPVRATSTDCDVLASYLTKVEGGWGAGLELARLDLKSGKGATPAQLLARAVDGDPVSAALFSAFEIATQGRRRIVASPGLMGRCGVVMVEDDDAALGEMVDAPLAVVELTNRTWNRLAKAGLVPTLTDDLADVCLGRSDGWPWPPDWLRRT